MKKIFLFALVIILSLSLLGCGKDDEKKDDEASKKHPYFSILTQETHPVFGDSVPDIKKFYESLPSDIFVVGRNANYDKAILFFHTDFDETIVDYLHCNLSLSNGGLTINEALPIIESYLPKNSTPIKKGEKYTPKVLMDSTYYLLEYAGGIYAEIEEKNGCIDQFSIRHGYAKWFNFPEKNSYKCVDWNI